MLCRLMTFCCLAGSLLTAFIMSCRDIRFREVIDRELAWFAFFVLLPRLLKVSGQPSGHRPVWFDQFLDLIRQSDGGFILFVLAVTGRLIARRTLIGMGDILFALAAGWMAPTASSIPMVILAFLLALPFGLAQALRKKGAEPLPFIPFLTASAILIRFLPQPKAFF